MTEAEFCERWVREFEDLIDRVGADRIGGFFAEPFRPRAGSSCRRRATEADVGVCRKHDILFVADEVVTAFAGSATGSPRGTSSACSPTSSAPPRACLRATSRFGAVIFSDRVWNAMAAQGERWFTSGFNLFGHPVACAASLKTSRFSRREDLLGNAARVGAVFERELKALEHHAIVGQVSAQEA